MVTKLSSGKRKAFYINCLKYINLSEMVVNLNYIAALLLLCICFNTNFQEFILILVLNFGFFGSSLETQPKNTTDQREELIACDYFSRGATLPPAGQFRQIGRDRLIILFFSTHSYTILSYSYQPRFIWRFKIFGRRSNNFYILK